MHMGNARVIGCWAVDDVLIDPGPTSCMETLIAGLNGFVPRVLLLTHIHLDHAGASGSLVRRWPGLEVYVHERGAPHMIDPSRLIASATQLYKDRMEALWGEFVPVPEDRIRVLKGGERLFGDRFEVAYTPGHAKHHVSYLHADGTAYVGDVGGVRIMRSENPTASPPAIPPTPPPDIDVPAWHASLELIRSWSPKRLAMTHFGASDDVDGQLADVGRRLDLWAAFARDHDFPEFDAAVQDEIAASADPQTVAAYAQAAPRDQLYAGLRRYWEKLEK
jgi:glyoxylase-like metal-dependent hydrolase (beta-lactamase superfamily II)